MLLRIIFQGHKLPATRVGESEQEYNDKYAMYINPADRSKYKHIAGKNIVY